jgi:hypothetical protein
VDEVNEAYRTAAAGPLAPYLTYTDAPIVSSDIVTDPSSCIYVEVSRTGGKSASRVGVRGCVELRPSSLVIPFASGAYFSVW